jgi:hypothetical protein
MSCLALTKSPPLLGYLLLTLGIGALARTTARWDVVSSAACQVFVGAPKG